MKQDYAKYTQEDFDVWEILAKRQIRNLQDKAHPEYINCLNQLSDVLNPSEVPNFDKLNEKLLAAHGWTISVVPGLIPVDQFFQLLADKKFCSSTWLRNMDQLDYLEEPDMFHDIFGHIPLLMNKEYSDFVQNIGVMGVRYGHDEEVVKQLQRLYWFTIEFGLIRYEDDIKLYGAGIMSSSGESDHIFNDEIEVRPYTLDSILHQPFITSEIQKVYYEIDSFAQLYESVDELEASMMAQVG